MSATRENKEALNIPDDTKDIETNRVDEKVFIEENSTIVSRETYGDSFILGSATNAVLGTDTLGESNRVTTIYAITNPNNKFREHFRDTTFLDTDLYTADWNTTLFRLRMNTLTDHSTIYNTVAITSSIAYNDGTITAATLFAEEEKWGNDQIIYFLSANGGTDWEEATNGTEHIFTTNGSDLRVKILFIGQGGQETYIENLQVSYR